MTARFRQFFLIFLFTFSKAVHSQSNFSQYTTKNGLPSSEIYDVFKTKSGYLFFLTDKGVSRYNGYEFENYTTLDGFSENIYFKSYQVENGITFIYGMDNHIDIISSDGKLLDAYPYNDSLIKYASSVITYFKITTDHHLLVSFFARSGYLEIDAQGNVIQIPTRLLEESTSSFYVHPDYYDFLYPDTIRHGIAPITQKKIGTKTIHKPYFECEDSNFICSASPTDLVIIANTDTHYISLDSPYLEFGILDETTYWYSNNKKGVHFIDYLGNEKRHLLDGYSITKAKRLHNGIIWFTSLDGGVFALPQYAKQIIPNEIKSTSIYSMCLNEMSQLYVSFDNGKIYQLENSRLKEVFSSESEKFVEITYSRKYQEMLAATNGKVILLNSKESLPTFFSGSPRRLKELSNGNLAFAGYFGLSYRDTNWNKIFTNAPQNLTDFSEYQNHIYLASRSGLFISIDSNPTQFEKFIPYQKRVNCLSRARDFLMCGTHGEGIIIIRGEKVVGSILPEKLGSGFVSVIKHNSRTNEIWVGTNKGLVLLTYNLKAPEESQIRNLSNLLSEKDVTSIEIVNDSTWIGTKGGLFLIDRKLLSTHSHEEGRHLSINRFKINGTDQANLKNYDLSYHENRIEFNFGAISLHPGHELKYRYKLEGASQAWTYTSRRTAQYPNLAPGEYKFKVELGNRNGGYGEEFAEINFVIHPPFWKTRWFRYSLAGFIVLIIYLFFRFRILLYNKDLVREILRQIMKKLKKQTLYITVKESGTEIKILTGDILFVKSDGNYLEVHTEKGKYVIREKISNFLDLVPDPIEFIRVRRSYIVRIDKITQKGKKHIMINEHKIDIGETYLSTVRNIHL